MACINFRTTFRSYLFAIIKYHFNPFNVLNWPVIGNHSKCLVVDGKALMLTNGRTPVRFHTGYISFGSALIADVIFAWHDPEVVDILKYGQRNRP